MTGVESIIRRLFEGRARRWSVITLIGVALVVFGLPAADEYFALRSREQDLTADLAQAREQVQTIDELRLRAEEVTAELTAVQSQALLDENLQEYRESLVTMTRESGCQLRKLNTGSPVVRDWIAGDNPLQRPRSLRGKELEDAATGYQLRAQNMSLSVSGTLEETRALLTAMRKSGKMMHTTNLAIRPTGADRKNVVMELQFTLFGLEKSKAAPDAA